jgi:penicillin-binding protein activator
MNTKRILVHCLITALAALSWSGCATQPHVVEGSNKVSSMGIDTEDFSSQADQMIQSLLESGVLDKAAHKPAVLVVGRIVNNTTRQLDTDLLTKNIRVALNKSGKATTDVTGGALSDPDYTLSGKIIESRVRQGDVRQSTYTFQLSLSDQAGTAAWEEQKEITKQSERSSAGF